MQPQPIAKLNKKKRANLQYKNLRGVKKYKSIIFILQPLFKIYRCSTAAARNICAKLK